MDTIYIPSGKWRYDGAETLDRATQSGKAIIYTVWRKPRLALIMLRLRMSIPAQNQLIGQLRPLWKELTGIQPANGAAHIVGANDLRSDVGETLRSLPTEPCWFAKRDDIIAVLLPTPLNGDPKITFEELVGQFWELIMFWQARRAKE